MRLQILSVLLVVLLSPTFHTQPPRTSYTWKHNYYRYSRDLTLCDDCGGDVRRAYYRIPLVSSVRPVPHLKGQNRYNMVRYCCWNCGKGTDICISIRSYYFYPTERAVVRKIDTCPICGKENRMEVQL